MGFFFGNQGYTWASQQICSLNHGNYTYEYENLENMVTWKILEKQIKDKMVTLEIQG